MIEAHFSPVQCSAVQSGPVQYSQIPQGSCDDEEEEEDDDDDDDDDDD